MLGIFLLSMVAGTILVTIPRHRTVGIFVLIVPTMAAVAAVSLSFGAMLCFDWLARHAGSPQATQRWEIVAFWSWPLGLLAGGATGALLGAACAFMVVRWRARRGKEGVRQ